MKRTVVVLLAIMFLAATAWAQATYTPNADPLLGPHNYQNQGCESCHAPHGPLMEGSLGYLWGRTIPAKVYTTYQTHSNPPVGGTMDTTGLLVQDSITAAFTPTNSAQIHTAMCLSCHDTAFSGMTLTNPNNAIVDSAGTTLTHDHPVDVPYPLAGSDPTYWVVNVSNGNATFLDANDTTYSYGHPAKLYVNANVAYVECGSCHNPHAYQQTVAFSNGSLQAVNTAHFVRGQYDTTANQTNFCVSCHADKAAAWDGQGDQ